MLVSFRHSIKKGISSHDFVKLMLALQEYDYFKPVACVPTEMMSNPNQQKYTSIDVPVSYTGRVDLNQEGS